MVNTFMPYAEFGKTAMSLDYKRLGKQRVEAWQILNTLLGNSEGWINHPAVKMWRGYERALCEYGMAICMEWRARGYQDTMLARFVAVHALLPDTGLPFWVGDEVLHLSHQSNLKRKAPEYYDFKVGISSPYLWADAQTRELKWGKIPDETKSENGETK